MLNENKKSLRILLFFTFFMVVGFEMIMPLVIGYYVKNMGFSATKIAIALATRQFLQQGLAIGGGILADRINIKSLICLGVLLRAIGFSVLAYANDFHILIIAMFFIGLGGLFFETPYLAAFALLTDEKNRSKYYTLNNTVIGIAITIGPLLGAFLLNFDFKFVCFGGTICFILNFLLCTYFLPNIKRKNKTLPLIHSFKRVRQDKSFLLFTFTMVIFWLAGSQINISFPLKIQEMTGRTDSVAWMFVVYALITATLQYPLVTLMLKKFVPKKLIIIGTFIIMISLLLIPLVTTTVTFLLVVAIFSLGMLLVRPNLQNLTVQMSNPKMLGLYLGVNLLGFAFGNGFGSIIGGSLFDFSKKTGMTTLPWIIFAIIAFVSSIGFMLNKKIDISKKNRFH